MKILHTSDWHLGQNFMGKSRHSEHEAFFDWLLEVLRSESIDALLVSGDIFDTSTPPNYALQLYYDFLKELSHIQTLKSTIITAGNHDSIATIKAPKQLLQVLNVHVIASGDDNEEVLIPIKEYETTKAIVCAVPYLRNSVIRESLHGETISEKETQANKGIKNYYEKVYKQAVELQEDNNTPIIAMGHLTTLGSKTSESERDIYIGGTLDIGGDYLASMFDYVALGHLHINQTVGNNHVRYCGAPIALSFSESKNTQKVNIVTFTGKAVDVEELAVPQTKELIVIKGDLQTIQNALTNIENQHAYIEVHIQDDNPMHANTEIRNLATKLQLSILALKVDKTQKQLQAKELKAISLDELSINEVFEKRLEHEAIDDEALKDKLLEHFKQVVHTVQNP